ncbi:6662_t:CDS:2 [Acaulospora colombiana]|uniref:6662_t:CDS:1 n=1 Tax=Acaulospora colombiana TaxID=27376 RepID=A0ACA9KX94_9GLOM|nr:6662_t:CDS:2 [Acaulospora colombiana]
MSSSSSSRFLTKSLPTHSKPKFAFATYKKYNRPINNRVTNNQGSTSFPGEPSSFGGTDDDLTNASQTNHAKEPNDSHDQQNNQDSDEGSKVILGLIVSQNELASAASTSENMKYDIFDEFLEYGVKDKSQFYGNFKRNRNSGKKDNNNGSNIIVNKRTNNVFNEKKTKRSLNQDENVKRIRTHTYDTDRSHSKGEKIRKEVLKDVEEIRKEITKRALTDKSNKKSRDPSNLHHEVVEVDSAFVTGNNELEFVKRSMESEQRVGFRVFRDFESESHNTGNDGDKPKGDKDLSPDVEIEDDISDLEDWHNMKPLMTSTPTDEKHEFPQKYVPVDSDTSFDKEITGIITLGEKEMECDNVSKIREEKEENIVVLGEQEVEDGGVPMVLEAQEKLQEVNEPNENQLEKTIQETAQPLINEQGEKKTVRRKQKTTRNLSPDPLTVPWKADDRYIIPLPHDLSTNDVQRKERKGRGFSQHKR